MTAVPAAVLGFALFITPAKDSPPSAVPDGGITATVRGLLKWNDSGGGYYILVREGKNPPTETRVWLLASENKIIARQLEGLAGKQVVATGVLRQMPQDTRARVPPLGLYLADGFKIEESPAKRTEKKE